MGLPDAGLFMINEASVAVSELTNMLLDARINKDGRRRFLNLNPPLGELEALLDCGDPAYLNKLIAKTAEYLETETIKPFLHDFVTKVKSIKEIDDRFECFKQLQSLIEEDDAGGSDPMAESMEAKNFMSRGVRARVEDWARTGVERVRQRQNERSAISKQKGRVLNREESRRRLRKIAPDPLEIPPTRLAVPAVPQYASDHEVHCNSRPRGGPFSPQRKQPYDMTSLNGHDTDSSLSDSESNSADSLRAPTQAEGVGIVNPPHMNMRHYNMPHLRQRIRREGVSGYEGVPAMDVEERQGRTPYIRCSDADVDRQPENVAKFSNCSSARRSRGNLFAMHDSDSDDEGNEALMRTARARQYEGDYLGSSIEGLLPVESCATRSPSVVSEDYCTEDDGW